MALHLSRYVDERVVVRHGGEELVIDVEDLANLTGARPFVRLAFDGPRSFRVLREEIAGPALESTTEE